MLNLVANRLFNQPLLVTSDRLAAIVAGLGERFHLDSDRIEEQFAVELRNGPDSSKGRDKGTVSTKKAVMIIPVYNTLVHRHGRIGADSGYLTSYEMLGRALAQAEAHDEIGGVVLEIDSGGGEAAGIEGLSNQIRSMSKPVVAMVNEVAFSAGYWIASSADKVVITKSGGVGSIGAIAMHVDQSQMEAQKGLKVTVVASSEKKAMLNQHEPITKDGLNFLQERVSSLADTFLTHVATVRPQVKRSSVADAGLFFGKQAVDVGLADEIGSLEMAVEMARDMGTTQGVVNGGVQMAGDQNPSGTGVNTVAPVLADNTSVPANLEVLIAKAVGDVLPGLVNSAISSAVEKGNAEQVRSSQINTICKRHGLSSELAVDMIERGLSVEQVKAEILDMKASESAAITINTGINTDQPDYKGLWEQSLVKKYGEAVLTQNPRALGVQRMLGVVPA